MKKLTLLCLVLIVALSVVGCGNHSADNKSDIAVGSFSYKQVVSAYKENEPGVQYSGFENTSAVSIANAAEAVERAKNECSVEYDTIDVAFDDSEQIWRVSFYKAGYVGGGQDIYLDNNGITCLCVAGE